MKLYALVTPDGRFARGGGSSTPARIQVYETLGRAKAVAGKRNVRIVEFVPTEETK